MHVLRFLARAVFLPLLAATAPGQSYSFKVIAGLPPQSGTADGAGSDARFKTPFASASDAAGNVFVSDGSSHTIRKITPAGVVTTFAGLAGQPGSANGTGSAARFFSPQGMAVDSAGNVYVGDYDNGTIRKITPTGTVSTFAGLAGAYGATDGTGSTARFNGPSGLAVDAADNIYVADWANQNIRKISPAGVVSTLAGVTGVAGAVDGIGTSARFKNPAALALDSSGNIYVADNGNNLIRKITPSGIVTTLAGGAGLTGITNGTGTNARFIGPIGVAVDSAGNIFVSDVGAHNIRKITPAGAVTNFAGAARLRGSANGTGTGARFYGPISVSVDRGDNLYVSDYFNYTIRKITSAGVVTNFAGPGGTFGFADGIGRAARFDQPLAIAVNSAETLFVADTGNNTIRKITADSTVTTLVGLAGDRDYFNANGSAARLGDTQGLALDANGNLYASDGFYDAIRLITPTGNVTTFAGMPLRTGSINGQAAASTFNTPAGVAIDAGGNLYVADSFNHVIRKITPELVVTTLAGLAGQTGTADGTGTVARFNAPNGIATDTAGNIYVADTSNHTIRKITPEGAVTTLAGDPGVTGNANGTGSAARFKYPYALAVDQAGNVVVTDTDNQSIRRITPQGVVTTIGGVPSDFTSVDGSGTNARFVNPIAITISKSGVIYIVDAGANTIVRGEPETPPVITSQPLALTVTPGSTVVMTASATGGGLTYQWRLNGLPIAGATNSTLVIPSAQSFVAGGYTLVITNGAGSATTTAVNLSIATTTDSGRISNLAIRSQAGTGAQTLIVGTVVGGAGAIGTKPLLMRGVGPTLAGFGVSGALADPLIDLFAGTNKIAGNDDWAGSFDFASVGAFAFTGTTPKDAALYNAATPLGSYSIQISGKNGGTGTALAEIYDATAPGTFTPTTPRLINLSARTQVGTDADILIAGFTIGGATAKTVLIRAAGPALTPFGVEGALVNPKLEIYRGSTKLYTNDDWAGNAAIANTGASVGAFPFANSSKDAALLLTLPPGGYTAQISGEGGTTGIALVEVYEVP